MGEQKPLASGEAWRAVTACFLTTFALLARHRVRPPEERLGTRVSFGDGTSARVYRETRLGNGLAKDPCTLVVTFRLRLVRGLAHALFRRESLLRPQQQPSELATATGAGDQGKCLRTRP